MRGSDFRFGFTALGALLVLASSAARAEPIAVWTFESVPPPSVVDTAVYPNPLLPDVGTGIGAGVHLSPASDWTTFVGNGSPEAFSSTVWTPQDYYGFQTSSLGFENIRVSWDQTRSDTGPAAFRLVASTNGVDFTTIQDYVVLFNEPANGGIWNENVFFPNYHYGPIALGPAFADKAAIFVRLVSLEASSTITGAVRVDNFGYEGDPLPPHIEVIKTDDGANPPVEPGDRFSYDILVQHTSASNQDAVEVVIVDALPAGVRPAGFEMELVRPNGSPITLTVAEDGDQGEIVDGVVTVRVGDLGLLEDAMLSIPVEVESRPNPGTLDNSATVSFDGSIGGLPYTAISNTLTIDYVACTSSDDCGNDNPCVASVACVVGVCVPTFNTAPCDDGNACTEQEACSNGVCVGGQTRVCDDGKPCTDDSCAATGCVFTPNDRNSCSDDNVCTIGDACAAGECRPGGELLACDDGDVCTNDACNRTEGCLFILTIGNTCDDGNACTEGDSCASGSCAGTPSTAACDDGSNTTHSDTCAEGACIGTPYTCAPGQCELTSVANGTDCTVTFKPAATACDDGQLDTRDDICDGAGLCAGTGYTCTPEVCRATSVPDGAGCTTTLQPVGTACDDVDPCTASDACDAGGNCVGAPVACGDGELCDAATGTCESTHCVSCAADAECGPNAECVALTGGKRCLVACESVEDCAAEQVCAEHAGGSSYCFDQGDTCAAPVAEVVEPGPEVQPESDSLIVSGGASCAGGDASWSVLLLLLGLLALRRRHATPTT